MPALIEEKTKKELKHVFEKMPHQVRLVYFTQENECPACRQQRKILEETAALTDKLDLEVYDFLKDKEEAERFLVDKIPATAVLGKKDYGIRFYGLTAGYEFQSFIEAILMIASLDAGLTDEFKELIAKIDQPVHLEVMRAKNVVLHTDTVVTEITGAKRLTGIRMQSGANKNQELAVDGVFLEIGLSPNTSPVKDLLELNDRGEIVINRDNETSTPGLYAAGDVTDIPHKQIVIAAAEGAKAALSAYDYLIKHQLVARKRVSDSWQ